MNKNEQWHMNEVWDVIEEHDPGGIDRGEIIQKAVLLYAALLADASEDVPDWADSALSALKAFGDAPQDKRNQLLASGLDVALARLKDGE